MFTVNCTWRTFGNKRKKTLSTRDQFQKPPCTRESRTVFDLAERVSVWWKKSPAQNATNPPNIRNPSTVASYPFVSSNLDFPIESEWVYDLSLTSTAKTNQLLCLKPYLTIFPTQKRNNFARQYAAIFRVKVAEIFVFFFLKVTNTLCIKQLYWFFSFWPREQVTHL